MARYVDVEPISNQYHNTPRHCESEYDIGYFAALDRVDDDLSNVPTADVAPVIHAQWEKDNDTIKCSNCGFGMFPTEYFFKNGVCFSAHDVNYRPKACPDCAALMDNPTATLRGKA